MNEQPIEPRNIAAAVVELAHPLLLRAWHYTLDEHALTTVPGDIRRHGLRVPHDSRDLAPLQAHDTEALALVREWSPGSGVLVGPVGCGKSYAAVWWLLEHARAGLAVRWLQAGTVGPTRESEAELSLCKLTGALVIDDVGAGNMSAWLLSTLNGLMLARLDAGRPTLLVSNATAFAIKSDDRPAPLLDSRTFDRLRADRVVAVGGPSLRSDPPDDPIIRGHGGAWRRASALLELVGVTDAAGTPIRAGERMPDRPLPGYADAVFGGRLELRLAVAAREAGPSPEQQRRAKLDVARLVCDELGLDVREVAARARALQAAQSYAAREALDAALAELRKPKVDGSPARPAMSEREAAERAALVSRREQTRLQLAKLRAESREREDYTPPRIPSRAELRRYGYATEQRPSGWALTHRPRDERGKMLPPYDVETWLRSEDEAWAVAESHYQD